MRTVTGEIVLPGDSPDTTADHALIEVRDVSLADVPSALVAQQKLPNVRLKPNGSIPFSLQVPEVAENRTLALQIHINLDGSGHIRQGDLLTTASHTIPSAGTPAPSRVSVSVI